MHIIRFIFPFLFVRNWYNGQWELSRARLTLFMLTLLFLIMGILIAYILQMPVVYTSEII
jgi:hypothetical protein